MAKIVQLPDDLSNKIAAGEVVERPASVVKEPCRKCNRCEQPVIEIDVEEAGLASIKVLDDGEGMDAEDCRTAFCVMPQAKSKTKTTCFASERSDFAEKLCQVSRLSHT